MIQARSFFDSLSQTLTAFIHGGLGGSPEVLGRVIGVATLAGLLWLGLSTSRVLERRVAAWAAGTSSKLDDLLAPLLGRSLRVGLPVLAFFLLLATLDLPLGYAAPLAKAGSVLLILAAASVAFKAVSVVEQAVLASYDITVADNLRARKVYTQVHVLSKVAYAVLVIFSAASVLMLFKEVRSLGTSLLASAGVLGIIAGFAAQKTIANLFAGFQLALTEPIRLDDVVIVEGEWGRIEEITLTYVVIRIWDDRRLVVPLGYFIEKPFQNWTRVSADLLGAVTVWADYTLPVDEVRAALKAIIEPHPLWDGRFWNLQVTDASERSMQLRVLATSADSSKSWDLRCEIRERLIAHLQASHPDCLPRLRASLGGPPPAP